MRLPAISARSASATSIWPRWPRSAWMRGSNGVSEPFAASVASAPVISAAWNTRSIANSAAERLGGGELRAVEQREAFLRAEHQRRQPRARQRRIGRHALAVEEGLADAEHRGGHVRERREIARRADRALLRHHRDHAAVEHLLHEGERFGPHAGRAAREARELQRHHQPHVREAIGAPTPAACESTMLR